MHKLLMDYVLAKRHLSREVTRALCAGKTPLPIDNLLKLEAVTENGVIRRQISGQLLRHPQPKGIERDSEGRNLAGVSNLFRVRLSRFGVGVPG
jgi:hypothetical protein